MCCLHERNMLHGDLKTGNLLITDDMNSVVITDFGLAGIQGQSVTSGALTVHISPPEVLLNPKAPRTQSCDVYAFGIVMLELLLGRRAFMNMGRDTIKTVVVSAGIFSLPLFASNKNVWVLSTRIVTARMPPPSARVPCACQHSSSMHTSRDTAYAWYTASHQSV